MNIVMGCANHWTTPWQVGSHHIARELVKAGHRVAFVSTPLSPLHRLPPAGRDPLVVDRFALWRAGGRLEADGRLFAYVPLAALAPRNRFPLDREALLYGWPRLTCPGLRGVLAARGFAEPDLLYLDNALFAGLSALLRPARTLFRIPDKTAGFARTSRALIAAERRLAASADLVLHAAGSLADYVRALGPKRMLHLPNGVRFDHFHRGGDAGPEPAAYAAIPRPRAVYAGALEDWFDVKMMTEFAAARPDVAFVLVGPAERVRHRLPALPNLHLLGRVDFAALPAYLRHADVGLVPFDAAGHAELVDHIHPLKVYEYLACGLPVVSASWDELRRLALPIRLYASREAALAQLDAALADPGDRALYVETARAADWAGRVRTLLAALEACGR